VIRPFAFFIGLTIISCACNTHSKANTWSEQQKSKWTTECLELMKSNGMKDKAAKDFCDCMLEKTSDKYTPEEAANITREEERKIWENCDYQW